ncbi:P-loop containing nucleoside triphosphate hydrolase protein [Amylostereum chailletii]|nr:P-loop containing nucleoside triphosphate hydrolase protein [Amylostereum chailletii]
MVKYFQHPCCRAWPFVPSLLRNHARYASTFSLRPYQEACLDACLDALQSGVSRIGVSLPTGAGKTAVFVSLLSRLQPAKGRSNATRSLVIVNSVELARQAAAQASKMRPDWTVEIEQGAKHQASGRADVTVATYQTLLQPQRLSKFSPADLKAVVVDEAHHAAAPSYRRLLSQFNQAIRSPDLVPTTAPATYQIPIFGFSATFSRHDGLALGSVFERIVYHRDFLQMIKEEWLCNVRFTTVRANIDFKQVTVNSRTGDFNPTSLAHVVNTDTVNHLIVRSWLDKAGKYLAKAAIMLSTLVFCVNIAHVRELTKVFRAYGLDARYVYSGTPLVERKELVRAFRAGEYPVLLNCAILTEGADIPNIDCVVVARPTRSRNVFAQMIGRGMRLSPDTGKLDCRVIDFVDVLDRVQGIVSTPTLFGLDPSEVVDGETTENLEERVEGHSMIDPGAELGADTRPDIPDPTAVTFVDYDDPFSLVNHASGTTPHIMKLSSNAWVGCGDDIYVLECLGKGHIRIEPVRRDDDDGPTFYRAHFAPATNFMMAKALKLSPFQHKRHVMDAETLPDAVRGCDTYALAKILKGPTAVGLLRTAKWRREPASASQKQFVAKKWGVRPQAVLNSGSVDELAYPDRVKKLTKGEAANIITRLKHGAQTRYSKKVRELRKATQAAMKENLRQARERVRVGPLPA